MQVVHGKSAQVIVLGEEMRLNRSNLMFSRVFGGAYNNVNL